MGCRFCQRSGKAGTWPALDRHRLALGFGRGTAAGPAHRHQGPCQCHFILCLICHARPVRPLGAMMRVRGRGAAAGAASAGARDRLKTSTGHMPTGDQGTPPDIRPWRWQVSWLMGPCPSRLPSRPKGPPVALWNKLATHSCGGSHGRRPEPFARPGQVRVPFSRRRAARLATSAGAIEPSAPVLSIAAPAAIVAAPTVAGFPAGMKRERGAVPSRRQCRGCPRNCMRQAPNHDATGP